MENGIAAGDHRPPVGAAGVSGAARSWVRPLTSRVAASPYSPALTHPALRRLLPGVALIGVDLHGSASLLGTFWAVFGVGAVAGELAAPFIRRRWPVWPTMTAIVIGWGVALIPLGLPVPLWAALIAFFAAAVIWGPWTSLSMAVFQDASPPSELTSLLAVRGSLLVIAAPLGGPLVAALGARGTLLTSATATVAIGVAAVVRGRARSLSPIEEPGFRVPPA